MIDVRCPFCKEWNNSIPSCYEKEEEDGEFRVLSFNKTCEHCNREFQFNFKVTLFDMSVEHTDLI